MEASADGRFITESNGASRVPVWSTAGPASREAVASAEAPLPQQKALAISPDGSKLAVAGPGEIYVAPVTTPEEASEAGEAEGEPAERPMILPGQNADMIAFAGDSHLITADGGEIGVWDTEQLDRLARSETVPLAFGCEGCGTPNVSVSPDGQRVAVLNNSGSFGFVQSLRGKRNRQMLPPAEFEYSYGFPIWQKDGDFVAFPVWPAAGGSDPDFPSQQQLPSDVRLWPAGRGADYELADALTPDGETAITVDSAGAVYWHDADSGASVDFSPPVVSEDEELESSGAVSSISPLLALTREGEVTVEELPGRNVVSTLRIGGFPTVAFATGHLLVQLDDGRLEVWNERGTKLERTLPGNGSFGWLSASSDGKLIARSRSDGLVSLDDLESGSQLAIFPTRGASSFYKTGLSFSPDDTVLVALSEIPGESADGELVERDISDAALIRTACAAAGRELSAAEWRLLVGTDPPGNLRCR
ncbi:MAG: WD40 repeat domain-containing protein [Thermoleophilia bacterium]